MKKELALILLSVTSAVVLALGLIRWLAPELLGIPADLRLVAVDRAVPPFYEGVFRKEHLDTSAFQLQDPLTRVRNLPLLPEDLGLGPHDILGFRNRSVPNVADVVVIGDSQTYGNNAVLAENWPSQLETLLAAKNANVYAMAAGGWCGIQYADMFLKAIALRPRVVVVAFYSGNDPLECFSLAYGSSQWQFLRPDDSLSPDDAPGVVFPSPPELHWKVDFPDGPSTVLTPDLRLASNTDEPAARAGWAIMEETARRIASASREFGIAAVFTVIPTKELAYAKRIAAAGLEPRPAYAELVRRERRNIDTFLDVLRNIEGIDVVDAVEPLQKAAMEAVPLYPKNENGHPNAAGYRVIAEAMAPHVLRRLADPIRGLKLLAVEAGHVPALVAREGAWLFISDQSLEENGWKIGDAERVSGPESRRVPIAGVVRSVDRDRFGPEGYAANPSSQ